MLNTNVKQHTSPQNWHRFVGIEIYHVLSQNKNLSGTCFLHNTYAEHKCFSLCHHLQKKTMSWQTFFFNMSGKAKGFILITTMCNHTKKAQRPLQKAHLEGTHGLAQTTPTSFWSSSSFSMCGVLPESGKARRTDDKVNGRQEAHILMASSPKILAGGVKKLSSHMHCCSISCCKTW